MIKLSKLIFNPSIGFNLMSFRNSISELTSKINELVDTVNLLAETPEEDDDDDEEEDAKIAKKVLAKNIPPVIQPPKHASLQFNENLKLKVKLDKKLPGGMKTFVTSTNCSIDNSNKIITGSTGDIFKVLQEFASYGFKGTIEISNL